MFYCLVSSFCLRFYFYLVFKIYWFLNKQFVFAFNSIAMMIKFAKLRGYLHSIDVHIDFEWKETAFLLWRVICLRNVFIDGLSIPLHVIKWNMRFSLNSEELENRSTTRASFLSHHFGSSSTEKINLLPHSHLFSSKFYLLTWKILIKNQHCHIDSCHNIPSLNSL